MTVGIIGLGLIGGSMAKAYKENSGATVLAADPPLLIAPNPNAGKTVTVRVESPEGNLFYGKVPVEEGNSVLDAAEKAFAQADIDGI